jgi:hypothetical protein
LYTAVVVGSRKSETLVVSAKVRANGETFALVVRLTRGNDDRERKHNVLHILLTTVTIYICIYIYITMNSLIYKKSYFRENAGAPVFSKNYSGLSFCVAIVVGTVIRYSSNK